MKNAWIKCLTKTAGILSAFAVLVSAMPCVGHYYQPEVPAKLRDK